METKKRNQTFSELIHGKTPVLVDFYADWCGPCKMMSPILKNLKKIMGNKLTIIKIDTDRNQEVAAKYQIRGVPTLILFQNGEIRWRQAGVVPAKQLQAVISRYIN